jgi:phosphoglycolate phosphatase
MVLRKLFDRYYAEAAEEGSFLFPAVADTLAHCMRKACRWRW